MCSSSPVWISPSRHSSAAAVPRTRGSSLDVASCHFFPFPSDATGYVALAGRGQGLCLIPCSQTSLVRLHYLGCRRITKGWKNQFEEALEGFGPLGGVGWNLRRIGEGREMFVQDPHPQTATPTPAGARLHTFHPTQVPDPPKAGQP